MSISLPVLAGVTLCLVYVLYLWHKEDSDFNLKQLIVDNVSGKVSLEKFLALMAGLTSTWGFVTLTMEGKLSEWYFIGYLGAFVFGRFASSTLSVYKDVNSK